VKFLFLFHWGALRQGAQSWIWQEGKQTSEKDLTPSSRLLHEIGLRTPDPDRVFTFAPHRSLLIKGPDPDTVGAYIDTQVNFFYLLSTFFFF
jgi:hypothetical protein